MKKTFLIMLLLSGFAWAQSQLILPEVEKSLSPSPKPQAPGLLLPPLQLPQIQTMVSLPPRDQMPTMPPFSLPSVSPKDLIIGTDRFDGGLNRFFPVDRLSSNQTLMTRNLVPYGLYSLKKRWGYQKIYFTSKGPTYGMAIADSAGTKPHLVVATHDSLWWADSSSNWELVAFDSTETAPTYFTSTPFGLVVSNDGLDSTRLWDGVSVEALGVCDTGTFMADSTYTNGDTAWVTDSLKVWAVDYWIGYWVRCKNQSVLYKIIDSGVNWLVLADCRDSCDAESSFVILARPDSVSGGLIYPKGQATAYYQDRLFVSSAFYPNRIYYSQPRLIDDIPPDAIINLDMDAHDEIQAMWLFNNYLFVAGKYSIYGIDRSLNIGSVTKSLGLTNPNTIAIGDDYIYFLSVGTNTGIYRFKGNIYGSLSYSPEKISDPILDVIDNIDPENLDNCGGFYLDKQYWFSYHPDSCMIFDERTSQWTGPQTFGFSSALSYAAFALAFSEVLVPGADGDTTDWTTSTGSDHYACVNEPKATDKYVYTNNATDRDFFLFGNTQNFPTGGIVRYLAIYITIQITGTHGGLELDLVANEQRYHLSHIDCTPGWFTYGINHAENPITSAGWTKGDIDSLELALRGETGTDHSLYVASIYVKPQYQGGLVNTFLFAGSDKDFVYSYGGIATDDTSSADSVHGIPVIATYQSGWSDGGYPTNQKVMKELIIETEKDAGTCSLFIYKDFETTAIDTQIITSSGKNTDWLFLPATVAGKKFSIKIQTGTNIDSLTLKGWSALLKDLGKRK